MSLMENFLPNPGFLLVEDLPEENKFASKNQPQGNTAKKAKVLKCGFDYINNFGVKKSCPCDVGDVILYEETPAMPSPIWTVNFNDYPVIIFDRVLGVIK